MSKKLGVPVLLIIIIGAVFVFSQRTPEAPIDNDELDVPEEPSAPAEEPEDTSDPEPQPGEEQVGPLRGVSLSPEAYTTDEFLRFFQIASESGEFISWVGDVTNLADPGSAPYILYNIQDQYSFEPMIITSYFSQSSGEVLRELNETSKQQIIDILVSYISENDPEYLGFGVEVNIFAKSNPEGYAEFVPFYDEVYWAVKDASPTTKVFTVFQLEQMKGLDGGLFGGVNDPEQSTWETIDDFENDLVVFTTYPCLIYKDPAEIPDNYYSEIMSYTSKPVAFSEMGWYRDNITGWESSAKEQVEFIEFYQNNTGMLPLEFSTWSFLYDPDTFVPFDSMGLLEDGEPTSAALDAWKMR
jgi:hypothetical protein